LKAIHIQAIDMFGPHNVGFIKFKCQAFDKDGDVLPGWISAAFSNA
jgi:hypothetical protein